MANTEAQRRSARNSKRRAWANDESRLRLMSSRWKSCGNPWTAETFNAAWKAQDGKCACCGIPMVLRKEKGKNNSVCAEHDHVTNERRGLTCRGCNILIGYWEAVSKFGTPDPAGYLARFSRKLRLVGSE